MGTMPDGMGKQVKGLSTMNVTTIPTDQIHPNDYNPNELSEEEYAELVSEVRHLGRLPKPVVACRASAAVVSNGRRETTAMDRESPTAIVETYRTRRERLAPSESEITIPLRGKRGHGYLYGPGWAGVWLNTHRPNASLSRLQPDFPRLIVQQVGDGECMFRVPFQDLVRLLPKLGARIRARPQIPDAEREWRRARAVELNRKLGRKHVERDADAA